MEPGIQFWVWFFFFKTNPVPALDQLANIRSGYGLAFTNWNQK
jgi:hypothetical protein